MLCVCVREEGECVNWKELKGMKTASSWGTMSVVLGLATLYLKGKGRFLLLLSIAFHLIT